VRYGHQMDVVGHQAVADERKVIDLSVARQQFEVNTTILVCGQDALPRIPTLRDVVRYVNGYDARPTSHGSQK